METLSLWVFGLLFISLSGAHGLNNFPENFVVANRNDDDPVTLTCGAKTDQDLEWRFNGKVIDVDSEDHLQQDGPNLTVSEVDVPTLGEYSCWAKGQMLSSTFLLLEAEEEEELDSLLSCRAKSYDCVFSCNWTNSGYDLVRLGLGPDCSEGGKSCHWVNSRDLLSDGAFQFEVSHSLSAYAEESTMLKLTAEAITDLSILRKTKSFFLRDIVQPDSPQIVRCQAVEQNLNVTIDPPSSWSIPHSFFSLQHEIEYVLKDDGKTERSLSSLIPKGISKLRVRSRDSVVLSSWSQWTNWKNVITEKKKACKCKNAAKFCCPELPSEYLDLCKNRKKKKGNKNAKKSQTS
uniref:interleukin-12 subunit beta n=1 Tax=Semicossyphus pulcher TaxID=241346 RepID=UPI0037E851D8